MALLAAPSQFAVLPSADAGRVVGRILTQETWVGLVLAIVLLLIERGRARRAAERGEGSVLSAEMLLLLGAVFCSVAAHFGVQPMMPAARGGQGPMSFGQLHLISTLLFGVKTLLVVALAWRAAASPVSRAPSS